MGERTQRPIPREELAVPEGDAPTSEGPTTVRPPPPSSARGTDSDDVATYQKLRESCRVPVVAADDGQLDDELAVEAEVLRVALDRKTQKPGAL